MSISTKKAKAPVESSADHEALEAFSRAFLTALSTLNTADDDARFTAGRRFRHAFQILDDRCAAQANTTRSAELGRSDPFGPSDAGHQIERVCQETGTITLSLTQHTANICVTVEDAFTGRCPVVVGPEAPTAQRDQFETVLQHVQTWLPPNESVQPSWKPTHGGPLLVSLSVTEDTVMVWSNAYTLRWWNPTHVATRLNTLFARWR